MLCAALLAYMQRGPQMNGTCVECQEAKERRQGARGMTGFLRQASWAHLLCVLCRMSLL